MHKNIDEQTQLEGVQLLHLVDIGVLEHLCKVLQQVVIEELLLHLALKEWLDSRTEVAWVFLLDEQMELVGSVLGQVPILFFLRVLQPLEHKFELLPVFGLN